VRLAKSVARLALSVALVVLAVVWPFTSTPHNIGPVLADFGHGHGVDLPDLLSIVFLGAALLILPGHVRRRRNPSRGK
jgi:hypothetical protein